MNLHPVFFSMILNPIHGVVEKVLLTAKHAKVMTQRYAKIKLTI